ncbi:nuclear transport factor 2 family protein [Amycolatopsis pithecellobii]|nr:nuclear transport factor 2 family protein [Amycolatopsis pithecellobii]
MCTTAVLLDPRLPDQTGLEAEAGAVRTVLLAERTAKDLGQWELMASAFAPDARVSVSWFQGSGADFVESARARSARGGSPSFHEIGAISVVVRENRALADTGCAVHIRGTLEDVPVDVVSRGRLCWRAERLADRWLIAGMDMIYFRDNISAVEPGAPLALPGSVHDQRPSYRHLAVLLRDMGHPVAPDLPGADRPDLIEALFSEQRHWFFS